MRFRLISACLTAVWLTTTLIAGGAAAPRTSGGVRLPAPPVTIPFELANRHIVLKVRVNGSRPLSFVLDTGADAAIVMTDVAKELNLTLTGAVRVGGAGDQQQTGSLVQGATWSLVGLDGFSQPVSLALPLRPLSAGMGQDIDGIIGGQFIRQFVVQVDYQAQAITLHDRTAFAYSGRGETVPIDFYQGHPILSASVTPLGGRPIERRFVLDIGSGMALALSSPFVAEQHLLGPQAKTVRLIGAAGAGGAVHGQVGRVESLQIGPFQLKQVVTMFSQDTGGALADATLAGNIGSQIASRFRVFLDYGRKRLILEPSPTFAAPFGVAMAGVAVRAEGADYRTFTVKEVLEDSPATEAGLVVGDVITAINGTPAGALTLSRLIELFEQPVTYELTVRRGDAVIQARLTPRKLVEPRE